LKGVLLNCALPWSDPRRQPQAGMFGYPASETPAGRVVRSSPLRHRSRHQPV